MAVFAKTLSVFNLLGCNCQNSKCEAGNVNCNDGNYLNGSIIVLSRRDVGRGELQTSHINSQFLFYFLACFSPRHLK